MSLSLHVAGERWRRHLLQVAEPELVPVAKGNGYGFGLGRLARRTQWLSEHAGVTTLAVGTYFELPEVATRFEGELLVLTPWRPFGSALTVPPALARRVVHTVSRSEDLAALLGHDPGARFVVERITSMRRHGMTGRELRAAATQLPDRGQLRGVALHLPLASGSHAAEVRRIVHEVVAAELPTRTVYVSHLSAEELAELRSGFPDFTFRPRVGTGLWLGDRAALRAAATVLDVHPVQRGDQFGYRGRSAPRDGCLVVVSGGTAHGIGLAAPTGDPSLRARAASLARGGLDAVGFARSPFSIDGKLRLFAEPPHMQASMLFLPAGARVPAVGDQIEVRVRFTATAFDQVVID